MMNRWYSYLPDENKCRMFHNLKNLTEFEFDTASFELMLLGLFVDSGWPLESVEPAKSENASKPDFLFKSFLNESLIVEATVATGVPDDEREDNKKILKILAKFEKYDSPYFRFSYRCASILGKPDSIETKLKKFKPYIEELSKENLEHKIFKIQFEEFQIQLFPEVRPSGSNDSRVIRGLRSRIRSFCKYKNNLASAVKKKLDKYSYLDKPVIIAVNDFDSRRNKTDLVSILFGEKEDDKREHSHNKTGLINGKKKSDRSHISGVLYFRNFSPLLSCENEIVLIRNPYATRPVPKLYLYSNLARNITEYNGRCKISK